MSHFSFLLLWQNDQTTNVASFIWGSRKKIFFKESLKSKKRDVSNQNVYFYRKNLASFTSTLILGHLPLLISHKQQPPWHGVRELPEVGKPHVQLPHPLDGLLQLGQGGDVGVSLELPLHV